MEKTKEDTKGLLLRLVMILIILITLAWVFGPSETSEVKTYTWNKEKGELDEQEIYQGDDFTGMLRYTFGDWFEPEEKDEK